MDDQRPSAITAEHLKRKAIVYVRQSTQAQVKDNPGSTAHQRSQVDYALQYGWSRDRIEVIDEDQGLSGSAAFHRSGYTRMMEEIKTDLVGAIFAADLSRLGRKLRDSSALLDECSIHDVRLVDNGRVLDMKDKGQKFMATILLGAAEYENDGRRDTFYNARLRRAMDGYAVSPPPVGYVAQKGQWLLDPDLFVREAVATVFRVYLAERSMRRTVARLLELGVQIPRRRGHIVYWVSPDLGAVSFMLRNRAYCGDYVFRKRRVEPRLGRSKNGRWKERPSSEQEMIVIKGHHEAYIGQDEWNEIQQIITLNARQKSDTNLGGGQALLKDILRCARHAAISQKYKIRSDGTRHHYYTCNGDNFIGGRRCESFPGESLERMIIDAVKSRLEPPNIETVRAAWRESKADVLGEQRRRDLNVARLRDRAADLERRYGFVDPANRLVAADLEAALEAAKRELNTAETTPPPTNPADLFTEATFQELAALCRDFSALWTAPTTDDRDRKEILKTMIKHVVIDERSRVHLRARIKWADEMPDTPIELNLPLYAQVVIKRLTSDLLISRNLF